MKAVYTRGLPLLAATLLACEAHVQEPPPGMMPNAPLAPMVDAVAQQAAPTAQRIAPVYESASTEEDGHTDWNVPLQAGQCYTIAGVGGPGVKHLFLYLWSQVNGHESRVATEKPDRADVVMRYCPVINGVFHLQAKTGEGHGPFAVGVYAETGQGAPAEQQPVAAPMAAPAPVDLSSAIDNQAASAAPGAGRIGNFFTANTDQGDRTDWPAMLEAGRCYWFIGAGDQGVRELFLYLWDPAGHRVTENRARSNQSVIGHCPTVSGMYKVQAKVGSGKGTYQMGIYVR